MVYRIEDTDKERSKDEFEADISAGLNKLGLTPDEGLNIGGDFGPYKQSERTDTYVKYLQKLLDEDKAYYCFCTKEELEEMREEQIKNKQPVRYDGRYANADPAESKARVEAGEKAVIRLRVPNDKEITWNDHVRGEVTIHSKELDDFVIARSQDDPLYHLTVVADDHDMEITHVIRGEDHISNTPKQMLLFEALGWDIPEFAHLPLILNEDKTKLSKRKNSTSVDDYLDGGILPEGLINFLALLGWNTSDEQEIFTMEELTDKFDLGHVHKAGAVFDLKRLDWINSEHIKAQIEADVDTFYDKAKPFLEGKLPDEPEKIKELLKDPDFAGRFSKLTEIAEELSVFFEEDIDYDKSLLLHEKFKVDEAIAQKALEGALAKFESLEFSSSEAIKEAMKPLVEELELKPGQIFMTVRAALSGKEKSPNFSTLALYLGKEKTLERINFAISKIVE